MVLASLKAVQVLVIPMVRIDCQRLMDMSHKFSSTAPPNNAAAPAPPSTTTVTGSGITVTSSLYCFQGTLLSK